MSGCRKHEDLLARYQEGESLLQDLEELEMHLVACPDCERLHRDTSEMDFKLREYPGKRIDPPAHLHSRILANLPEAAPAHWARWWRVGLGLGTAAAMLLAIGIAIHRGDGTQVGRIASAPAPDAPKEAPRTDGHGIDTALHGKREAPVDCGRTRGRTKGSSRRPRAESPVDQGGEDLLLLSSRAKGHRHG